MAVSANAARWAVRTKVVDGVDTATVFDTEGVKEGASVYLTCPTGNTSAMKIGGVGDTGTADKFLSVSPGSAFPVAVAVQDLQYIEFQSPTGTDKLTAVFEKAEA